LAAARAAFVLSEIIFASFSANSATLPVLLEIYASGDRGVLMNAARSIFWGNAEVGFRAVKSSFDPEGTWPA
jgi:hypothetical protein